MEEYWKTIESHPNYEVSTLGNFRHKKSKKPIDKKRRYYDYEYVMIDNSQKYVHRIVAKTFIPNPKDKPQVNHINHKRNDNRVDNLEWVTFEENIKKAWEANRFKKVIGENNHNTSLTEDDVIEIKYLLDNAPDLTQKEIAKRYNVSNATITGIKNGRVWSHVK